MRSKISVRPRPRDGTLPSLYVVRALLEEEQRHRSEPHDHHGWFRWLREVRQAAGFPRLRRRPS